MTPRSYLSSLLTVLLILPQSTTTKATDLNLGLGYREQCGESSTCHSGYRLGIELRLWQSGKRGPDYSVSEAARPPVNIIQISRARSLDQIVMSLLLTIFVFGTIWALSMIVVGIFSGRNAVGVYLDLEKQNLDGGALFGGNFGLTMSSYLFDEIDFGFSFSCDESAHVSSFRSQR